MLLLEGSFEIDGVTLYRDHVAPRLFHYLPGRRARRRGRGARGCG